MATQFDTQLQQLYVAYFNRPADPAGLAFYAGHLTTGATTIAAISAEFAKSLEYKAAYSQSTYTGVVTAVYQNLFGHAPDQAGLDLYVNALSNGSMSVDQMVTWISGGAQGADQVAYNSKVQVAVAFTNALDATEAAAYNNAAAQTAAKAMLSTIKTAAQATAAVEPAALDASIAGVVKAGTPFTLETGLNALGAADKALVDFYAAAKIDVNGDDVIDSKDVVNEAAVTKNVGDANTILAGNIDDATFATRESVTVRAALIAEQEEINDAALTKAQDDLTAARAETAKVAGLDTAIAAANSADEAAKDAQEAFIIADASEKAAVTTLQARNSTAKEIAFTATTIALTEADTPANGATPAVPGKVITLATLTEGQWVANKAIDASKYPGLTELVAARNVEIAAEADAAEAKDASMFAQLEVEIRDQSGADSAAALAGIKFTSDEVTPKDAAKPTVTEITNELSALESQGDATAIATFKGQIQSFLNANVTAKADLVEARDDTVTAAQKTIADLAEAVTGYEEAQALATEMKSLQDARAVAIKDFTDNKFAEPSPVNGAKFGTTGSDIFVFNKVDATITSFGRAGDDVLYVGSGYTLNKGDLDDGVATTLEVFFTQKGTSTEVTIESKAYGSESGDVHTITLTGVTATDLTFENGIISL